MKKTTNVVTTLVFATALGAAAFLACSDDPSVAPTPIADAGSDSPSPVDASVDTAAPGPTADVQLLDISDWHGQLDVLSETDPITTLPQSYGGLGALMAYFAAEKAKNANTLVVTGGDAFGATPALSNFFDDEPAVKGLNLLGIQVDTFGNHNFDRGNAAMKKLLDVATYKYVSTNLDNVAAELGSKVITPFAMFNIAQVNVAVLGLTNKDAPELLQPGRMGTLVIKDAVTAANATAKSARAAGAHVVVALAHLGATGKDGTGAPTGPLLDVAKGLQGIDILFGDHTDQGVNVTVGQMAVTENRSKGRGYTKVVVSVVKGAVSAKTVTQVDAQVLKTVNPPGTCDGGACACPATACADPTFQCVTTVGPTLGKCQKNLITPDPAAEAFLKPLRDQLAVKFDAKASVNDQVYLRDGTVERLGEVPVGDLITDAMLDRYKAQGAEIAFTNGGGIRAPLPSSYAPVDLTLRRNAAGYAAGPPYDLVIGDVYTVLPFGNLCVVRKITGQTLWAVLEKSVEKLPAKNGGFLQIAGFKFTYNAALAVGSRIVSVTLDAGSKDIPKTDLTEYTIVTNDFTNAGGDGYAMLIEAKPSAARDILADVLLDYLKAHNPLTLPTGGRITGL